MIQLPGDRNRIFTRCVEAVMAWTASSQEQMEDLQRFSAPSECYRDVGKKIEKDLELLVTRHGLTPIRFEYEMARRGLTKWAQQNGVVMPLTDGEFVARVMTTPMGIVPVASRASFIRFSNAQIFAPPNDFGHRRGERKTFFRPGDWVMGKSFGMDRILIHTPERFPEMWWSI